MSIEHVALDPASPLCWESSDTLRFGFDSALVRMHAPSPGAQRFIGQLREGVDAHKLRATAARCGLSATERQQLLEQLDPVLLRTTTPAPRPGRRSRHGIAVLGGGAFADRVRAQLESSGMPPPSRGEPEFAIILERFLGVAARAQHLLSDDIPHLPIRLTDRSLFVGPLVPPGGTPCLSCLEQHRLEREPLHGVLAAQLAQALPSAETDCCAELAGTLAVTAIRQWRAGRPGLTGQSMRFSVHRGLPEPIPTVERIAPHPECACLLLRQDGPSSPEAQPGLSQEARGQPRRAR